MLDCRIAANFIPYGRANTNKRRNKILRVNDLLARQAHYASLRITTTPACIRGFTPGKSASTAPRTRFGKTALRQEE
jgi:hypothetical protein